MLPFPLEECLLPGETKTVHLYEARFLSLMEDCLGVGSSARATSSEVGHLLFTGEGYAAQVLTMCEIVEWRKEEIGVTATLLGRRRARLLEVIESEPYLRARVVPFDDWSASQQALADLSAGVGEEGGGVFCAGEGETADQPGQAKLAKIRSLVAEVTEICDDCDAMERKLRGARRGAAEKAAAGGGEGEDGLQWGHSVRTAHLTIGQRVSQAVNMLYPGLGGATEGQRVETLSFLSAAALEPGMAQVQALQCRDAAERLAMNKRRLLERRKLLAAQSALLDVSRSSKE